MTKRALVALPLLSTGEQVTVVRPTGNRLPDFGRHAEGSGPSVASVALTE
jgi:hypothetical protein